MARTWKVMMTVMWLSAPVLGMSCDTRLRDAALNGVTGAISSTLSSVLADVLSGLLAVS